MGVPRVLQCGAPPAEGRASALLCHGLDMRWAAAVRSMCCTGCRAHSVRCILHALHSACAHSRTFLELPDSELEGMGAEQAVRMNLQCPRA